MQDPTQQDLFSVPAGADAHKPAGLSRKRNALLSDFETRVAERAAEHDLSAAMVHYARELVALQDSLEPNEQRALLLLVLASIIEQRHGSTRLPLQLAAGGGDEHLGELIGSLMPAKQAGRPAQNAKNMEPGTVRAATDLDEVLATLARLVEAGAADTIMGEPGEYRPLVVDGEHLYHQRMLHYEDRLVDAVRRRLAMDDAGVELDAVGEALQDTLGAMPTLADGQPMRLNPEQQYALLTAAFRPLTFISGGPGTGKTSIVVSLLRLLARLGVAPEAVALAAPTGKAANRLGESIAAQLDALGELDAADQRLVDELGEPRTLHRLLGYSPARNGFYYHENNRLRQRVVIVDEASMIDLFLMERLISAVDPSARLILLGDAEQLPSVDSGAVFRDLVPDTVDTDTPWRTLVDQPPAAHSSDEPTAGHAVRLETSYRMDPTSPAGANILRAAQSLNRGDAQALFSKEAPLVDLRAGFDELGRAGVEMLEPDPQAPPPDPALMNGFVDWWYGRVVADLPDFRQRIMRSYEFDGERFAPEAQAALGELFAHYSRFRTLTITRVFATGSERLNAAFHARHLRFLGRHHVGDLEVGEPVIMLQNDYRRGLFNGDQGLILDVVRTDGQVRRVQSMAVFARDGAFVPFNLRPLRHTLEHAFALTVHKAQGSEFDSVAVVLPTDDIPLLSREILYTGMTRSRRSVVLIGARQRLEAAANNPVRRFSGVAEKLGDRGAPC